MKKPILKIALLTLSFLWSSQRSHAQSTDQYKQAMDKWWQDYAACLKKMDAEPDDQKVIITLQEMKGTIATRHQKLVAELHEWKKTHDGKQLDELETWTEANPHEREVQELSQSPKFLSRLGKNRAIGKAYRDFNLAMMKVNQ